MRKLISTLFVLMAFIFIGCSSTETTKENYIYKGENENWSAEYKVESLVKRTEKNSKVNYEGKNSSNLKVTYKKDLSNLDSIKNLKISYESSKSGGSHKEEFNENTPKPEKIYELQLYSNGIDIEKKDEVIKVSIEIDDKREVIELKSID